MGEVVRGAGRVGLEPAEFSVPGPVRVLRSGSEVVLGGPQERALLALLLVRAGQPVPVGEIIEVLWGPRAPRSAVNVVRRHVGSLRRLVEPGLPARAAGRWLARDAGGYRWAADTGSLDLLRFRRLREEAGRAAPSRAVGLLTAVLDSAPSPSPWPPPGAGRTPAARRSPPRVSSR